MTPLPLDLDALIEKLTKLKTDCYVPPEVPRFTVGSTRHGHTYSESFRQSIREARDRFLPKLHIYPLEVESNPGQPHERIVFDGVADMDAFLADPPTLGAPKGSTCCHGTIGCSQSHLKPLDPDPILAVLTGLRDDIDRLQDAVRAEHQRVVHLELELNPSSLKPANWREHDFSAGKFCQHCGIPITVRGSMGCDPCVPEFAWRDEVANG